jgi:hypothetical protein
VVHDYIPSTWEAKAEGLKIQGQPGLSSKTLSQKTKLYLSVCLSIYIYLSRETERQSHHRGKA